MAFFPFLFSLFFFEETNSETSSEVEPLIKDSPITVRDYADWPLRDLSLSRSNNKSYGHSWYNTDATVIRTQGYFLLLQASRLDCNGLIVVANNDCFKLGQFPKLTEQTVTRTAKSPEKDLKGWIRTFQATSSSPLAVSSTLIWEEDCINLRH